MEFKKKLVTALATGAVIINSLSPIAFADTTLVISGNGTDSNNTANINISRDQTVVQENRANISNYVNADADTGKNDANDNTGGDVSIETGDADVKVNVNNTVNTNASGLNCCDSGNTTVNISGNGSDTDNDANLNLTSNTTVFQDNNAKVHNDVYADADTGKNDANDNTGGKVTIETGDADVDVSVSTMANVNSAQVGDGEGGGADLSLWILGNGTGSDNEIDLDLDNSVLLTQENRAKVYNYVDADADTGKNDANDNTGGDVTIETGDADAEVNVDNMLNFNFADIDCGCLLDDVLAKIAGNGEDSDNDIKAKLSGDQLAFQSNCGKGEKGWKWWDKCKVDNDLYADADTGKNDANDNTGPAGDPTVIETGDADAEANASNSGNVNVLGDVGLDLPDFDLDLDLSFSFDLGDLLALLGLLS